MDGAKVGERSVARVVVTVVLAASLVYTLVLNGLAGPGLSPFNQSTGNVSDLFFTCITPAGYTFSIWGLIYTCLCLIVIYAVALLFVRVDGVLACELDTAVSVPFMLTFAINLNLNVGWLFAWDATNATASAILLMLVAMTNAIAISLSAHQFSKSGKELYHKSKFHFWASILMINGYGIYDAWTCIASFVNIAIFFTYEVELALNDICIAMLSILLVGFLVWFIVENTWLATMYNPLITEYLVLVWAMVGIYVKQRDIVSEAVLGLIIASLSIGVILSLARMFFVGFRNRGNRIYGESITRTSPALQLASDERY